MRCDSRGASSSAEQKSSSKSQTETDWFTAADIQTATTILVEHAEHLSAPGPGTVRAILRKVVDLPDLRKYLDNTPELSKARDWGFYVHLLDEWPANRNIERPLSERSNGKAAVKRSANSTAMYETHYPTLEEREARIQAEDAARRRPA